MSNADQEDDEGMKWSAKNREGEHYEYRPPCIKENNLILPLLPRHHLHRSTVAQYLADTARNLGRIIAHTDERICTQLLGVLDHQLVGRAASSFAELCVERNVATCKLLE